MKGCEAHCWGLEKRGEKVVEKKHKKVLQTVQTGFYGGSIRPFLKLSVFGIDISRHTEKIPRRLKAGHNNTSQPKSRPSDHVFT